MRVAALCFAAAMAAIPLRPTDDEARVVNVIVDEYVEMARDFWARAEDHHYDTMRGRASELHASRLAVSRVTMAPLKAMGSRKDYAHLPEEDRFEAIRRRRTPLYRAYAALPHGQELTWLKKRKDLIVVSDLAAKTEKDPEKFYARHAEARGLLTLSAPAVIGDEAFIYAQLMMVYSEEGVVYHLRKVKGRWRIDWKLTLYDLPGC
ncbi:MAG TPA: hypothetical protein VN605_04245 [Thermoanaerobaculia bacterium]|nr:hypothetical protein [Thermoanaerobaculia bacterium]